MTTNPHDESCGIPLWMPVIGLFTAAISYFWMRGDHVAASVFGAVTISGFSGYRVGAAKLAGFIGGAGIAVAYAPHLGRTYEPQVANFFGTTGLLSRVVSIGIFGLGITIGTVFITAIVARLLLRDRPRLGAANRWAGFLFGGVQGTGIMLLLLGGILVVEPMAKKRLAARAQNDALGRAVSQRVVEVAAKTRESRVGPMVVEFNPFQRVPQLSRIHGGMKLASDPKKLSQVLDSQRIEQLKQRPAMRDAIDSLSSDTEIQQVLHSGQPIDPRNAMSLMRNPTILKLLDQPEFIGEMSKLLTEAEAVP